MAVLCLKCFNEIFHENKTIDEVYIEYDICENCKENTLCVLGVKEDKEEK